MEPGVERKKKKGKGREGKERKKNKGKVREKVFLKETLQPQAEADPVDAPFHSIPASASLLPLYPRVSSSTSRPCAGKCQRLDPQGLGHQGRKLDKHPRLQLPSLEGPVYVLNTSSEGAQRA